MIGIVTGDGNRLWRLRGGIRRLSGTAFFEVAVPYARRERYCARILKDHGVRTVLYSKTAPFDGNALRPWNITRLSAAPFIRAHGGMLAMSAIKHLRVPAEESIVALHAEKLSADLCRAAEFLCPRVKHVALTYTKEKEKLARRLYERYGQGILWAESEIRSDVAVNFDPTQKGSANIELQLYEEKLDLGGARIGAPEIPVWNDIPEVLQLAALWECGALPQSCLRVEWT